MFLCTSLDSLMSNYCIQAIIFNKPLSCGSLRESIKLPGIKGSY